MTSLPQIEPSELITKYEFHPEIMDVFVEGEFDRDFLTSYLESVNQLTGITILPIDQVNINSPSTNSNKEAVITLANFIQNNLTNTTTNSIFIVDADCERINGSIRSSKYLHYTDFTCMEMYFYNSPTLRKFLCFTCNPTSKEEAEFIKLAELILPCIFTARSVNDLLALEVSVPNFSAGLKTKGDFGTFDNQKYLTNFSSLITNINNKKKAIKSFQEILNKLPEDLRHKAHGHDFINLLFEFLWKRGSLKLINKGEDILRFGGRILGTALNAKDLSDTKLFEYIHKNLSQISR